MDLKEIINPKHTAILVIDAQEDFLSRSGHLAKTGQNIRAMQSIIPLANLLIVKAKKLGMPIIFSQFIDGLNYRNAPGKHIFDKKERLEENICCRNGSKGSEFFGIIPKDKDIVLIKHSYSAFYQTELTALLKTKQIKTIIVVGVKTNGCVETTVREAFQKGFFVVVPQECVASDVPAQHESSLKNIERYFGDVTSLNTIFKIWDNY